MTMMLLPSGGAGAGSGWSSINFAASGSAAQVASSNGSSLSLAAFRPENFRPDVHAASFKCRATNRFGTVVSTAIKLRPGSPSSSSN